MIRKKQLNQDHVNLNKTKEVNAKVTVQYIQEQQQLIQKPQTPEERHQEHHTLINSTQDDLEIENVEYLEDNTNVAEYIDEHSERADFENNFYPNAIHCLLDLYKAKYENLNVDRGKEMMAATIWRDIAKQMQESFFEFNERQIQQKYFLLREQYFSLQTKDDIENFDYFEQLHDIYKDPDKEAVRKHMPPTAQKENHSYKDEFLVYACHNSHLHDFKNDEIAHKENEFIDMVEKELLAMGDGGGRVQLKSNERHLNEENRNNDVKTCYHNDCNIDNSLPSLDATTQNLKKPFLCDLKSNCESSPPKKKLKIGEYFKNHENAQDSCCVLNSNEFSLFQYNQQQERRHREKMFVLEKYLQLQERVVDQQQQLLRELIKRLPS